MIKLIVVVGATGTQGGSVARALLNHPEKYRVRAITRDATKPKAQELAKLGAELATADLRDNASIREALKDAYGVYAVTDYWAQAITELGQSDETEIGIALAEAANAAGVKHFVWSTLPPANEISNGKYDKIEHFETKARVTKHIQEKLPGLPTTYIYLAAYFEILGGPPFVTTDANGDYTMSLPVPGDISFPMTWSSKDTGPIVQKIFDDPTATVGKTYELMQPVKLDEVAATLGRVKGKNSRYVPTDRDVFIQMLGGGVAADDILGNLEYYAEYHNFGTDFEKPHDGRLLGYQLSKIEDFFKAGQEVRLNYVDSVPA